jgi:hypothetical protein
MAKKRKALAKQKPKNKAKSMPTKSLRAKIADKARRGFLKGAALYVADKATGHIIGKVAVTSVGALVTKLTTPVRTVVGTGALAAGSARVVGAGAVIFVESIVTEENVPKPVVSGSAPTPRMGALETSMEA